LGITLREGWCLKEGVGSKRLHQASCPTHITQLKVRKKKKTADLVVCRLTKSFASFASPQLT
jgi:hypothetical protein